MSNITSTTGVIRYGSKTLYTTPNPFEAKFGYFRAVRKANLIFVSGTTALKDVAADIPKPGAAADGERALVNDGDGESQSKVLFPGDARQQASVAMKRCVQAVEALGGKRGDVVRVRMFVSRFEDCGDVGEAFSEWFGKGAGVGSGSGTEDEVGAVATMVVVREGFVDVDVLVEVEVDAVV